MKVLQVTTHLNIGGISNYILSLSCALKQREVKNLVISSGGDLEDEFKKNGIETKRLDIKTKFEFGPKVIKSIFELASIIRDEGVDIIHSHTRVSQVASFFASRIPKVPYVTTCHGFFKKRLSRRIFDSWGDYVIAISEPVRKSLVDDFKIRSERVMLIYNGIEIDRFSRRYSDKELSEFKKMLGLNDSPIVGTVGRLSSVKGHKFLIEAICDVLSRGYNVQCIIVGDGPEGDNLKKLVEEFGIAKQTHFFKSTADASMFFAIMDIFVFPSLKEGLGLSLLEAMASGLACVASDVGGISDIIKDGSNGLLFPVGDVSALAESIIRLLNDGQLKKHLGQNAMNLAKERFPSNVMADKVMNLYNDVLKSYAV